MKRLLILAALVMLVFAIFIACGSGGESDDGKLSIVTTTGMIADAAENIGGNLVNVVSLMGPGVDPHLYKASEGDVERLSSADLILFNGLHLEAKMGEVLERLNGRITTVAVAETIQAEKLIEVDAAGASHDPHVWFDVTLWASVAAEVKRAIGEADPENKQAYDDNYQAYERELRSLQAYVEERIDTVPVEKRVLVTAHDAFGYFGKAYGFKVMGLQGISTVSEAGTADVRQLADFIARNEIPAIFVESSVPRKNIEALQAAVKARGFDVGIGGELFSDAMGTEGTEESTYVGMVKHNVDTIVESLTGIGKNE